MGLRDWIEGPKKKAAADAALREAIANGRLWVLDAALEAHRSEASEEVLGLARAARERLQKKRKKEKEEARVKAEAEAAARAPAEAEGDVVLLAEIHRGWPHYQRQSQSRQSRAHAMLGVYELQRDRMMGGLPTYRKSGTNFVLYFYGGSYLDLVPKSEWGVSEFSLKNRRGRWKVASSARTPGAITEPWNGWNGSAWVEVPSAKIVTLAAFKAEAKKRKAAEEAAEAKKRKDAKEAAEAKAKKRKAAEEAAEAKKRKDAKEAAEAKAEVEKAFQAHWKKLDEFCKDQNISDGLQEMVAAAKNSERMTPIDDVAHIHVRGWISHPNMHPVIDSILNKREKHLTVDDGDYLFTYREHKALLEALGAGKKSMDWAKQLLESGFGDNVKAMEMVVDGMSESAARKTFELGPEPDPVSVPIPDTDDDEFDSDDEDNELLL